MHSACYLLVVVSPFNWSERQLSSCIRPSRSCSNSTTLPFFLIKSKLCSRSLELQSESKGHWTNTSMPYNCLAQNGMVNIPIFVNHRPLIFSKITPQHIWQFEAVPMSEAFLCRLSLLSNLLQFAIVPLHSLPKCLDLCLRHKRGDISLLYKSRHGLWLLLTVSHGYYYTDMNDNPRTFAPQTSFCRHIRTTNQVSME